MPFLLSVFVADLIDHSFSPHCVQGGSMVNQILPYLGQLPYVLHRLDMNTSGGWRLALRFMTPYFVLPRSHYIAPAVPQ